MDYRQGFARLKICLAKRASDSLPAFHTMEERFVKNEENERIFGSSENTRHERSQVIYALNDLAMKHCGRSFNELCQEESGQQSPSDIFQGNDNSERAQLLMQLQNKIIDFLTSLPGIQGNSAQEAFVYSAGLDPELQREISFGGSSAQFFRLLVQRSWAYGELSDGRDALEAVLKAAKGTVGGNRRKYCDSLIEKLREI